MAAAAPSAVRNSNNVALLGAEAHVVEAEGGGGGCCGMSGFQQQQCCANYGGGQCCGGNNNGVQQQKLGRRRRLFARNRTKWRYNGGCCAGNWFNEQGNLCFPVNFNPCSTQCNPSTCPPPPVHSQQQQQQQELQLVFECPSSGCYRCTPSSGCSNGPCNAAHASLCPPQCPQHACCCPQNSIGCTRLLKRQIMMEMGGVCVVDAIAVRRKKH
ncbi:hypothetical protein niasHT_002181 [Heterodera trifolii]|uniref:Uncharacterized protein n=1 Tax=Heterodera trifolii TaxID=157864 RepID=A0ABD2MG57_9BILA